MIAATLIGRYLAGMIIGYILGSIPFGLILAKRLAGVDVREWGSGNIGATNVTRGCRGENRYPFRVARFF